MPCSGRRPLGRANTRTDPDGAKRRAAVGLGSAVRVRYTRIVSYRIVLFVRSRSRCSCCAARPRTATAARQTCGQWGAPIVGLPSPRLALDDRALGCGSRARVRHRDRVVAYVLLSGRMPFEPKRYFTSVVRNPAGLKMASTLFEDGAHRPPWSVSRLGPLLRTPERSRSILEAYRGLRNSPQAAPKLRIFHFQPAGLVATNMTAFPVALALYSDASVGDAAGRTREWPPLCDGTAPCASLDQLKARGASTPPAARRLAVASGARRGRPKELRALHLPHGQAASMALTSSWPSSSTASSSRAPSPSSC